MCDKLNTIYMNARSVKSVRSNINKITEMLNLIAIYQPHLLAVTETFNDYFKFVFKQVDDREQNQLPDIPIICEDHLSSMCFNDFDVKYVEVCICVTNS